MSGNPAAWLRFGELLDRSHGPQVFLVESGNDRGPEWAEDNRHGDVKDQPPVYRGAIVFVLEGVVDMHVDCGLQLSDPDGVVKVDRPRRLKADDSTPPVLTRLIRFAVVVPASKPHGVRLDIGGAGKLT